MKNSPAFFFMIVVVARAADPSSSCTGWTQVKAPAVGHSDNVLASIAGSSATDVWTVGSYAPDSDPNLTETLTLHYDGNAWSVVFSPNVGSKANQFFSVTAHSGNAWAVGSYIDGRFAFRSLIEAWDGAQWSIVKSPLVGTSNLLFAVSAVSATDIWAVGFYQNEQGTYQTLTEHFDGVAWSVVPSPSPGETGNQLYAVLALAPDDVWAGGEMFGTHGPDQALIEHWNGKSWSVVDAPPDGRSDTLIYGLARTTGELLAVGSAQNNIQSPRTLVEVATKGHFFLQSSLNVGSGENDFFGVAGLPGSDVAWAVGTTQDPSSGNLLTLIARNGNSGWVQEQSPSPGLANGNNQLAGIVALTAVEVWAVGSYDGVNAAKPLILRRCP